MNTKQRLELIEKQGKTISILKDEIKAMQRDAAAEGYFLTYLYSDELFVYIIFTKTIFTVPTV